MEEEIIIVKSEQEFKEYQQKLKIFNDFKFDDLKCSVSGDLLVYKKNLIFLKNASTINSIMPFKITSFYRSKKHPLTIKNPSSLHAQALAIDCVPKKQSFDILANKLFSFFSYFEDPSPFRGIGLYSSHIHFDGRDKQLYWIGKSNGEYIYFNNFYEMINTFLDFKNKWGDKW